MRYFDKTFFKFTLGFLIIIAISLLIMYAASAYAAGVEKIVFTTNPQEIKPDKISEAIKVQFQDSSGGPQPAGESLKITFKSSSNTGTFLNESENPVSTTVQSTWTGRTFYYKDSSQGTFTITIGIVSKEWTTAQQITVSSGASQNSSNNNSSGEVLGASDSEILGESTTNVSTPEAKLEILAGNDRTTSPGSPIWFQATVKKNTTGVSPELSWSFGDGNVGVGPLVSHTYKYPGDYVVVLSAMAGDIFSVSRLKVKVIESNILVKDEGEYLEISNNDNVEVNLFNWKIENEGKGFIFQPNTIILPHSSIKLDKSILKMKGLDNSLGISLKDSLKKEIFAAAPVKEINLSEASKNLDNIKREALIIQDKIISTKIKTDPSNSSGQENSLQATTNAENVVYEIPKEEGLLSRAWHFLTSMLR